MTFFWLRYIVRSVRRSGRRALFAVICVAVGVAGVVALQTATLTVQNALTSNVRAANGGDISVAADDNPLSRQDLRVFRRLQRQGRISAWTAVYSMHATAVGPAGSLVPFDVNVVSPSYPLGGQPTFVSPSNGNVTALLRAPGDVLITSVLSDELGAHIGDRMLVHTVGGRGLHATIRGILAETSFQHSAVMTVSARDAARVTSSPPHYTQVYANTAADPAPVGSLLASRFPVATVQTVQQALQTANAEVHDFRQFMLLVGLLALLIAGIGILNAMQSMLSWRRLEIATLKAIGYRRWSLYLLFGGEALLLGLIGGMCGAVVGALASKIITDALATALAVQVTFQLDPGTLVAGVALGAVATLIFALMPIVRAADFRPLEILREGAGMSPLAGLPQTLTLAVAVAFLFCALAAAIIGDFALALEFIGGAFVAGAVLTGGFAVGVGWLARLGPPASRALGVFALAILVIVTVAAIARVPALAVLLSIATLIWASTILLPPDRRLALIMAVRALSRRRGRTAVILVAFLVGVLAMSVTLTVALSLQRQITNAIASNNSANLVAVASASGERPVLAAARRLPGINHSTTVVVVSTNPIRVNGHSLARLAASLPSDGSRDREDVTRGLGGVSGIALASGARPAQIRIAEGRDLGSLDRGTNHVIVRGNLRDPPLSLRLGDTVTLRQSGTAVTRTVRIVGFYQRARRRGFTSFFTGSIFSDRSLALSLGAGDAQSVISFNVDSAWLTHDATTLQQTVPGVLVIDVGDLTRIIETILGELLDLLVVITALALGAGLAVVSNGVALAMLERRREIALLKAIGFGPSRVLSFVLLENALVGGIAGGVGVLCVLVTLAILSRLALNTAIGFDPLVATLVVLIAAALAVLTAYLTARGPVRIRPIEALRND